jgi:hypothetical protein
MSGFVRYLSSGLANRRYFRVFRWLIAATDGSRSTTSSFHISKIEDSYCRISLIAQIATALAQQENRISTDLTVSDPLRICCPLLASIVLLSAYIQSQCAIG